MNILERNDSIRAPCILVTVLEHAKHFSSRCCLYKITMHADMEIRSGMELPHSLHKFGGKCAGFGLHLSFGSEDGLRVRYSL